MTNPNLYLRTLLLLVSACGVANAQSSPSLAPVQFASFGDFKLRTGAMIRDFRIGYRTLGNLNATKSNAILWPTYLGTKTDDLLKFTGPRNVVDTGKYFVILVESIGNGVSSSPSNSKLQPLAEFPEFSIRDMVEAEYRLVMEKLHLTHLHAVLGISMGGMQTFEWAAVRPDFMDIAVSISGSPQSASYDRLLWTAEIEAIELDPAWNRGHPTGPLTQGIALAEEIDSMNSTTPSYRVAKTRPEDFAVFLADLKKNARADAGTAYDQIRQRQAIIAFDLPGELGLSLEQTAKRIRTKMLVIVSMQDHTVNPEPAIRLARAIDAPVVQLDSPCGHFGLTCISVGPVVAQFLADPSTVHSRTLHEESRR